MGIWKSLAKNAPSAVTQLFLALVLHPAPFSNASRLEFLSSERGVGREAVRPIVEMFFTGEARIHPINNEAQWMIATRRCQTTAGTKTDVAHHHPHHPHPPTAHPGDAQLVSRVSRLVPSFYNYTTCVFLD